MSERTSGGGDTRDRILATALDLFARQGYQRTSLREIAERVGLTKAAILYHFPAKDRIMAALIEPLLQDLEAAIDTAERLASGPVPSGLRSEATREDGTSKGPEARASGASASITAPRAGRWAVLEGILDTYLKHRRALLTLRHDVSIIARQPYFQRFMRIPARSIEIIAGPGASLPERVRASQALSLLGDPLVFFPDAPSDELRALVLAGVHRLLDRDDARADRGDGARQGAARARGAGRPRALSGERLQAARRMYRTGSHSVDEIAAALGVSRATVYRRLSTKVVSKTS